MLTTRTTFVSFAEQKAQDALHECRGKAVESVLPKAKVGEHFFYGCADRPCATVGGPPFPPIFRTLANTLYRATEAGVPAAVFGG